MSEPAVVEVEPVLDARAAIGESPTWIGGERALYWIDVKAPALHRYDPDTGQNKSWSVTSDLGAFALIDRNAALVALREGIHRLNLRNGALDLLAPPPFDPAIFRFNEGACDAKGRFWVGTMFDPIENSSPPRPGALHSFTLESGLRCEPDAAEIHNGMAFSRDNKRFFLSHTKEGKIYAFDFDVEQGTLGFRRLFAEVPKALGVPDGAAIDREGGYWCAIHGGGRLRRYRPDGTLDRDIPLPVSQPTMCAFAGATLDTLYVTSASDGLDPDQRRAEPHAGALFRLKPGVAGIERRSTIRNEC